MSERREQVVDAAIRVLGGRGLRQLTHRAVDAEAGLPAGSTSNYLRTREAMIRAIVARIGELEQAQWRQLTDAGPPQPDQLAAQLSQVVAAATGAQRQLTLARHALFVEAAHDLRLREPLIAGWTEVHNWATGWLAQLDIAEPAQTARLLLEYLDGLILHQLALAEPTDPTSRIDRLLAGLGLAPAAARRTMT
ncbi:TetR/AcrR family transcriptional regulator [Natronosporangium hydrolyticum]|uniref:TetR/AcrR family transcriptional regulator n=1 Tax=Natronosporangium hydrolyticum TaxID=2811111 RepID=A0A895YAN9_9ACTN|nr:TetR/AcrR family transcriptional regulator [Natronosporangium hydrolyticum]QSB13312.1 TetR/AcrR family transcriptional regulator [Natronosporangium hydrolyticum]